MAEYIDKSQMLKYLEETNTSDEWIVNQYNADWIYSFIESQPAADVVPRSEYESLRKRMFPSYCQAITEEEAIKTGYERGKADVAKEIFEEIGKFVCTNAEDWRVFEELKKKYTEGK